MPRSLILAPTRELAMQVAEEFNFINKFLKLQMALLIGGVSFTEQDNKLAKGVDVLIATPGRLIDHMERGKVIIKDVKILIIDEADRMLDMGFIPDIMKINKLLPRIRQTLFFSATLSNEIRSIGKNLLINPKEITINPYSSTSSNIDSYFFNAYNKNKLDDLKILLNIDLFKSAVIFCNKKNNVDKVNTFLKKNNYKTVCLHGDMDQSSRTNSLEEFKNKSADILVASDVAARGIDIKDLSHVFNYDVPNNPEDYVHRIGRTGRAGKKGKAYTIFKEDDEKNILLIEKLIKKKIKKLNITDINLKKQKQNIDHLKLKTDPDKKNSKQNFRNTFLPIENFLNFKDSGQIPDFLKKKSV